MAYQMTSSIIARKPGSYANYDAYIAENRNQAGRLMSRPEWDALRQDFMQGNGAAPGAASGANGAGTSNALTSGIGAQTTAGAAGGGVSNNALLQAGKDAAAASDPFAPRRAAYADQLDRLMANPGDLASSPIYKFAQEQGINAIDRAAAAKGQLNSGNRLAELVKFGTGLAGQQFGQQADLLALLSGAKTGSPSAAGNALLSGATSANTADYRDRALAQSGSQFDRTLAQNALTADRNYELAKSGDARAAQALALQQTTSDRNYDLALNSADQAQNAMMLQNMNAARSNDINLLAQLGYLGQGNAGASAARNPWDGV